MANLWCVIFNLAKSVCKMKTTYSEIFVDWVELNLLLFSAVNHYYMTLGQFRNKHIVHAKHLCANRVTQWQNNNNDEDSEVSSFVCHLDNGDSFGCNNLSSVQNNSIVSWERKTLKAGEKQWDRKKCYNHMSYYLEGSSVLKEKNYIYIYLLLLQAQLWHWKL